MGVFTDNLAGGPTEITGICKKYAVGALTWPETLARLAAYPYQPIPSVPFDRLFGSGWETPHGGTGDELSACVFDGYITRGQLADIGEAAAARHAANTR